MGHMIGLKDNFKAGDKIPHDFLNTIARFWNELKVVPGSGAALLKRSDGHHTTISVSGGTVAETPDTAGFLSGTAEGAALDAGRKTIERNPEAHHHNEEWQLHDVDTVGTHRFAVPYFRAEAYGTAFDLVNGTAVAVDPAENRIIGTLEWAVIDGHSDTLGAAAVHTSLEVVSGKLQIGSFNLAGTCSVPFVAANASPGDKWLDWRYPVRLNGTPYAQGAAGAVDMLGFGASPGGTSYLQITLPRVTASVEGAALNLVPGADETLSFAYAIVGPINGTIGTATNHDDLGYAGTGTFAAAFGSTCADHDGRHFRRGNVGWAQNYCDEIGCSDSSGVIIDVSDYHLGVVGTTTLSWGTRQLLGTWTTTGNHNVSGTLSAPVVNAGTCYTVDDVQVLGAQQTGVGTYTAPSASLYMGQDNAQPGYVYAVFNDLWDLAGKVDTMGTYLASLAAALGSHGMVA
jgi:hypothetical protein